MYGEDLCGIFISVARKTKLPLPEGENESYRLNFLKSLFITYSTASSTIHKILVTHRII